MPKLLEVAQLAHEHGMAQVQVGRCGVKSGLDTQRTRGFARVFKPLTEVGDADDLCRAFLEQIELLIDWWKCMHAVFQYRFQYP
jgi:hypothetical protein